ncbi:MAG: type II and III secretion system protein [Planctomycetota bacterium]|nr:type II and III secretion system protein [Planctomycetota bacterium]
MGAFRAAVWWAALVGACAAGSSCRSLEPPRPTPPRQLTMEMFRELMQRGTLTPVDTMGDPFADIVPAMGRTPEDLASQEREAAEAAQAAAAARNAAEIGLGTDEEPELGNDEEPAPLAQPSEADVPSTNPYQTFGTRIKVHEETGLITKPYSFRVGTGSRVVNLLRAYGDFVEWTPEKAAELGPQGPATVRMDLMEKFDSEVMSPDLRAPAPAAGVELPIADWVVVTTGSELLTEVEYFIDTFFAGPRQVEIEAKIVEWVTRDSFDMGIGAQPGSPLLQFPDDTLLESATWDFPNQGSFGPGEFLGMLGTVHDGVTYSAMLELLSTFENVSIISRPKVAVREGGKARIESVERIPYSEVIITATGFTTAAKYLEVGVQLFVTPRLVGSNTVSLEIDISASQQTGSAATVLTNSGDIISNPVVATRSATTQVYLKPGQAVILGGLITERTVDDEKGIPLLKDLPILGSLFRSTFNSIEQAQVLFFIRPRVLEGVDLNREF